MTNPLSADYSLMRLLTNIMRKQVPGQLVIQLTDKCNATCPQCGMRVTETFKRSVLSSDDVKRIIDAAAQKGVRIISFTGGEPLLFLNELAMLIKYAGKAGIEYIRTGTNGFMFVNPCGAGFQSRVKRVVETLAETPLRNFWISIDSAVPSVHEEMRGLPGVIKGIEKALPIFHEHGIYPSVNLGINRNVGGFATKSIQRNRYSNDREYLDAFFMAFKNAFRIFYDFVIGMGFTTVNNCYPMSIEDKGKDAALNPVYAASSEDSLVRFSAAEKAALFKALLETLPEFRSKIRLFSPGSALYALHKQYIIGKDASFPCRGGIDFFYIDSKNGNTYPCGYRGNECLGKYWEMDMKALNRDITCRLCDWECFRDPSELFGTLLQAVSNPLSLLKSFKNNSHYHRLWIDDLKYYLACGFFNGRKPPDFNQLRKFGCNTKKSL